MLRKGTIILVVAICFGCANYRDAVSAFAERSVTFAGKKYLYRVFVPKNRDPNKKIPVMLFLHGSGARGDDNVAQIDTFRWSIEPLKDKVDFIAVLPQCKPDSFWAANEMANYALAALDASVNEFNGDSQRLYLAGFSLGGYGVWQIAAAHPGKFAALVPIAGGVVGERPIAPADRAAIIPAVGIMLDYGGALQGNRDCDRPDAGLGLPWRCRRIGSRRFLKKDSTGFKRQRKSQRQVYRVRQ